MSAKPRALSRHSEVSGADLGLIRRCLEGDTQAWADLYLRYRTPLYALCLSWTREHAFAEDVVHDAFVRAYEQMGSFDQTRRFFPWLATIARNCLRDIHRQRHGRTQVEMPEDAGNGTCSDSTLEAVIDSEERIRLQAALASLPTAQRTALLLAELGGLSYAEVARSIGASESAVKSLIFRARAMLRRTLQPLAVVVALRAVRRKVGNGARRVLNVASRLQMDGTVLETLSLSVAFATFGVLLPINAEASSLRLAAVVEVRSTDASASTASAPHSQPIHQSREPVKTAKPVRSHLEIGETDPGRVAPSEGHMRLEIVGPTGEVIYYRESGFNCEGQGANLLPRNGPIRAVC